jgi:hypothetical protein
MEIKHHSELCSLHNEAARQAAFYHDRNPQLAAMWSDIAGVAGTAIERAEWVLLAHRAPLERPNFRGEVTTGPRLL